VRSRTKTSATPLVSPATRFVASEVKTTKRPSALAPGSELWSLACAPAVETLTRVVMRPATSRTKTSATPLVSLATRLVADDWKATNKALALIAGVPLAPLPCAPLVDTLIRVVCPAATSRRNISPTALVSPVTRFVAVESKATKRPSPLMLEKVLPPFA
jgi:hypothetical protein